MFLFTRDPGYLCLLTYNMTQQEKPLMIRKLLRAALLALTLVLVACGGTPAASSDPTAAPSGNTQAKPVASKPVVESDPTVAPVPSMVTEPTPSTSSGQSAAPAAATNGDAHDIGDISGSLDGLSSYRLLPPQHLFSRSVPRS